MMKTAMALTIAFTATLPSKHAEAAGAVPSLGQLAMIGFGTEFLSDLADPEACRTGAESVGASAVSGVVGGTFGVITGILIGTGSNGGAGNAVIGGTLGGLAGRYAVGEMLGGVMGSVGGEAAGDEAVRRLRDYAGNFEYEACMILAASDVVRAPMLLRFQTLGMRNCARQGERDAMNDFTRQQWDTFTFCTARSEGEARELIVQMIRLNQATCRAIQAKGDAIVRNRAAEVRRTGDGSVMPFAPGGFDTDCDESPAADVWGRFVADRQ